MESIVKRAIEKATEKGFSLNEWFIDYFNIDPLENGYESVEDMVINHTGVRHTLLTCVEFAKAFWGEEFRGSTFGAKNWEYHLQRIILLQEKEKYLEDFL